MTESLATQLSSLTRLRRLLFCGCGMSVAVFQSVAAATSHMAGLEHIIVAEANWRSMAAAEASAATMALLPRMQPDTLRVRDKGVERELVPLARRESSELFWRAQWDRWNIVRWRRQG